MIFSTHKTIPTLAKIFQTRINVFLALMEQNPA